MNHAKRVAVLAVAVASMGCCPVQWPTQERLAPSTSFIRYIALAVKEGDKRCAESATKKEELEACVEVYGQLKTALLKLEGP